MHARVIVMILLVFALFVVAGCAAGPSTLKNIPSEEGEVAGFWPGLWHGIIAPITFSVSLFSKMVRMNEVHNNGGWYGFGFPLGVGVSLGGSSGGAASRRNRT